MARTGSYGFSRSDRVAQQVMRELAPLLRNRVKDPRVGQVTILDVQVSKDLSTAKVWFDTSDPTAGQEAQEALAHAAGFLRRELGQVLSLRVTPQLRFYFDDTQIKGQALSQLIDAARSEDEQAQLTRGGEAFVDDQDDPAAT